MFKSDGELKMNGCKMNWSFERNDHNEYTERKKKPKLYRKKILQ